jgi:subtilisin family serine protease
MSLGGTKSTAVNSAVANAVSAGVFMAVAAGNEAQNAANVSPASEPTAFTVGASDSTDKFASFSNFGAVVDIIAPGVSILSTWLNGGTVSQPMLHTLSETNLHP